MTAFSASQCTWVEEGGGTAAAQRCLDFLDSVGIEVGQMGDSKEQRLEGLAIVDGRLLIDPKTLVWPSDLLHEGGLKKMHEFISDTALWGDHISGPRVVDDSAKARMKDVLTDIQDGTFAREWIAENAAGMPEFKKRSAEDLAHPIEEVGTRLRSQMPWLNQD